MKDPNCPPGQLEFNFDMSDADAGYFCKEELQMSDEPDNSHYKQLPIECHELSGRMPSHEAQAFQYIWRCEYHGAYLEDLKKALWHIETVQEKHCTADHPDWYPYDDEVLQKLIGQVLPFFSSKLGSPLLHIVRGDHDQVERCLRDLIYECEPSLPSNKSKKGKKNGA